jgi:hypothetical protein
MYFRFKLLVYRFATKNVKKMNCQMNEKVNEIIYLRMEVVAELRVLRQHT